MEQDLRFSLLLYAETESWNSRLRNESSEPGLLESLLMLKSGTDLRTECDDPVPPSSATMY